MKLEYSTQVFKKYSNINFMTIHSVAGELLHVERQTDGHDIVNSPFTQREHA